MATLRQRLHRKNAFGTYDVVHLESESGMILRPSGNTIEESFQLMEKLMGLSSKTTQFVNDEIIETVGDSFKLVTSFPETNQIKQTLTVGDKTFVKWTEFSSASKIVESYEEGN